jgi:hypothetical protein
MRTLILDSKDRLRDTGYIERETDNWLFFASILLLLCPLSSPLEGKMFRVSLQRGGDGQGPPPPSSEGGPRPRPRPLVEGAGLRTTAGGQFSGVAP